MNKTCVIYLYREDEDTILNLDFFLKKGIFKDEFCDYHVIINDHECSLKIPNFINIHKQDNNLDFPSYKTLLSKINLDKYDYVYFLNCSCVGPFLPVYCYHAWYYYFNKLLDHYDLVGPIAEVPINQKEFTHNPFVHTYMFGLNRKGLQVFKSLLNKYETIDKDVCMFLERELSFEIINNNGKIKSLLSLFYNVDLNDTNNWNYKLWSDSILTCFEIPLNYHGIDVNPYEIIFVKNIRYPHQHRSVERSGISNNLKQQLKNYISWL